MQTSVSPPAGAINSLSEIELITILARRGVHLDQQHGPAYLALISHAYDLGLDQMVAGLNRLACKFGPGWVLGRCSHGDLTVLDEQWRLVECAFDEASPPWSTVRQGIPEVLDWQLSNRPSLIGVGRGRGKAGLPQLLGATCGTLYPLGPDAIFRGSTCLFYDGLSHAEAAAVERLRPKVFEFRRAFLEEVADEDDGGPSAAGQPIHRILAQQQFLAVGDLEFLLDLDARWDAMRLGDEFFVCGERLVTHGGIRDLLLLPGYQLAVGRVPATAPVLPDPRGEPLRWLLRLPPSDRASVVPGLRQWALELGQQAALMHRAAEEYANVLLEGARSQASRQADTGAANAVSDEVVTSRVRANPRLVPAETVVARVRDSLDIVGALLDGILSVGVKALRALAVLPKPRQRRPSVLRPVIAPPGTKRRDIHVGITIQAKAPGQPQAPVFLAFGAQGQALGSRSYEELGMFDGRTTRGYDPEPSGAGVLKLCIELADESHLDAPGDEARQRQIRELRRILDAAIVDESGKPLPGESLSVVKHGTGTYTHNFASFRVLSRAG